MKTAPIVPARIDFDHPEHPGQPFSLDFGDVYRPRDGEFGQSQHVFLNGHGLPARWQGRQRFVFLETGFGLGHNFLATWLAWRQDPQRCDRLHFIAIEKHPPRRGDLARAHAHSGAPELAAALLAAWPPLTHDLHTLAFDEGRVTLLLALGDVATWLPELVAAVDAFNFDGFAPARNEAMWDGKVLRACARLAAEAASGATWSLARGVHDGLSAAGFEPRRAPGFGGRREMTVATLRPLPRHPPAPGRRAAPAHRTALVIGAGLAGASAAHALASAGLQVTVLERRSAPAQETSGNVAGLFHGVLHPQDGAHAQLLRAASLRAAQVYRPLIAGGQVEGAIAGLLRGASADSTLASMQALLASQGLPPEHVMALDQAAAERAAACPVAGPAWCYAAGGWLAPAMLVRFWLSTEGVTLATDAAVQALACDALTGLWSAHDAAGQVLASADVVVVACASQAAGLLAPHTDSAAWPLRRTRGQITLLPPALVQALELPSPRLPLASGGYLLSLPESLGGGLLCGATSHPDDEEPCVRASDHAANLAQIGKLIGRDVGRDIGRHVGWESGLGDSAGSAALPSHSLGGRVGWRLAADDRLPIVGPVPRDLSRERATPPVDATVAAQAVAAAQQERPANAGRAGRHGLEQPRQVPRVQGLYVYTALGSRGITLAPLLAQALAAWVTGAPMPLGASLIDAIDPARFVARRVRQAARA